MSGGSGFTEKNLKLFDLGYLKTFYSSVDNFPENRIRSKKPLTSCVDKCEQLVDIIDKIILNTSAITCIFNVFGVF